MIRIKRFLWHKLIQTTKLLSILLIGVCVFFGGRIYVHVSQAIAATNIILIENGIIDSSEIENHSITNYVIPKTFIEETFEKYPLLVKIAWCESGQGSGRPYRQFEADGSPFKSRLGTPDFGAFQISDTHWARDAKALGLDYKHSLEDNFRMAVYILKKQGYNAWAASETCWAK